MVDGTALYPLPTAPQMAAAPIEQLHPTKITFRRMQLLLDIAARFQTQPDFGDGLTAHQLYDALLALRGIGPWTAAVTVGRTTGHFIAIPSGDVALQAAAARYLLARDSKLSAKELHATLSAYGEWGPLVGHLLLYRWVLEMYEVAG